MAQIAEGQNFISRLFARIDSSQQAKLERGGVLITPFATPAYSPEAKFSLTGGGLISFPFKRHEKGLERSSLPFALSYSTTGAFQFTLRNNFFGGGDKVRLTGETTFRDMPDHYWGVGYDLGFNRLQSDSTTQYTRIYWQFSQRLQFRLGAHWFTGPWIDFNRTRASNLNPLMAKDPNILIEGRDNRNMGLGWVFAFDSRDFPLSAHQGAFVELSLLFYEPILGANTRYVAFAIDSRNYLPLGREGRTLCWQARLRQVGEGAPWAELSRVGSPYDLRGYFWGRYRDAIGLFTVLEYRHMFKPGSKASSQRAYSPHGFVAWVGAGAIAPNWSAFSRALPNVGIGYRLEVQPRMNLRLDFGLGARSSSFYINFSEAF
jgi:hypothetical protein